MATRTIAKQELPAARRLVEELGARVLDIGVMMRSEDDWVIEVGVARPISAGKTFSVNGVELHVVSHDIPSRAAARAGVDRYLKSRGYRF